MTIEKSHAGEKVWDKVLQVSMAMPGAKVNRSEFLYSQLHSHCDGQMVLSAIESRPAAAVIPEEVIDRIADSCIKAHVLKASGISFVTDIPGGLAMGATIPADMAQYYWHAFVMAQKLAYLYGWPDLMERGEVDEETKLHLTLLLGTMAGSKAAREGITRLSSMAAPQVATRLARQPLTHYAIYNVTKQVGRWIGVSITKASFSRGVAKVIPVVGAGISAGVTAGTMLPMGKRLKKHLKTLWYAQPDDPGVISDLTRNPSLNG